MAGAVLGAAGCAHAPVKKYPAETLLQAACNPGTDTRSVQGSVWLKAKSKEASGQFPAMVVAETPATLKLEVTNLVGGPEALIEINGNHYSIKETGRKARDKEQPRSEEGYGSWAGIPLQWATELFLGRIPCPRDRASIITMGVNKDGDLTVSTRPSLAGDSELFEYHYRQWNDQPWPEALHWERKGAFATSVDFTFDDPEKGTGSPRKWQAKSPRGEVKVRWRDRKASR